MRALHWLDLVIVAIIAWLTFRALSVGLIREVVTAVAVIGGAILAGHFYAELADDISFAIEDRAWREFVAFAAIFVGAIVLGQIAAALLHRASRLLLLGAADRIGGAVFGFVKGVIIVEVLILAAITFPVSGAITTAIDDSVLAPVFIDGLPVVQQLLPAEFEEAAEAWPDILQIRDAVIGGS